MESDEPLIHTIKGNLPVASLRYQTQWQTSDTQVVFSERWLLDGEVVKENSHVHILQGVSMQGESSM